MKRLRSSLAESFRYICRQHIHLYLHQYSIGPYYRRNNKPVLQIISRSQWKLFCQKKTLVFEWKLTLIFLNAIIDGLLRFPLKKTASRPPVGKWCIGEPSLPPRKSSPFSFQAQYRLTSNLNVPIARSPSMTVITDEVRVIGAIYWYHISNGPLR